jgi:hypothetical protein
MYAAFRAQARSSTMRMRVLGARRLIRRRKRSFTAVMHPRAGSSNLRHVGVSL